MRSRYARVFSCRTRNARDGSSATTCAAPGRGEDVHESADARADLCHAASLPCRRSDTSGWKMSLKSSTDPKNPSLSGYRVHCSPKSAMVLRLQLARHRADRRSAARRASSCGYSGPGSTTHSGVPSLVVTRWSTSGCGRGVDHVLSGTLSADRMSRCQPAWRFWRKPELLEPSGIHGDDLPGVGRHAERHLRPLGLSRPTTRPPRGRNCPSSPSRSGRRRPRGPPIGVKYTA